MNRLEINNPLPNCVDKNNLITLFEKILSERVWK